MQEQMATIKHHKNNVFVIGVLFFLALYGLADSLAPRGVVYWRATFLTVYLGLFICSVAILLKPKSPLKIPLKFYIPIGVILFIGLIACFPDLKWPVDYIFGDFAIISMLFLFGIVLSEFSIGSRKRWIAFFVVIFIIYSIISFCVMYFDLNKNYLHGNRFDPPHTLAIAGLVSLYLSGKYFKDITFLILLFVTIFLVIFCQWRAALLFLFVALLPVIVRFTKNHLLISFVLFIIFTGVIVLSFNDFIAIITQDLIGTRYSEIAVHGTDESFMNRILEIQDVLLNISNENSIMRWLFGFGHGSMFQISLSYPGPNVKDGGMVHNIHIHLFLWLFRYGLFGASLYLMFVFRALVFYLDLLREKKELTTTYIFFTISAMILVVKSVFYTPINDPINLFLIAGFLQLTRKK
jgi:hypothetical protein